MIETMTKRVDIGVQNKERIISDVLKDESYRSLNRVKKIDNNTLEIEFSEQDFRFKEKRKVVQFSKKKYKNKKEVEEKIKEEKDKYLGISLWTTIQVLELPDVWLAFCKR